MRTKDRGFLKDLTMVRMYNKCFEYTFLFQLLLDNGANHAILNYRGCSPRDAAPENSPVRKILAIALMDGKLEESEAHAPRLDQCSIS